MEQWIPAAAAQETWPSQTLRCPEVTSTGLVLDPIRALCEVEPPKSADGPAPVEFSAVVYVVPPSDQELTAGDLRDRILRTCQLTGTLRVTWATPNARQSSSLLAGMFGPELQIPATSRPVSASVPQVIEFTGQSSRQELCPPADLADFKPVPMADSAIALGEIPPSGPRTSLMTSTATQRARPALPQSVLFDLCTPCPDFTADSPIARLDPVRIPPNLLLTFGCLEQNSVPFRLRRGQLQSSAGAVKNVSILPDPINGLAPRRARHASVFAPVLPVLPRPLQKTPENAEHLT